MERFVDYAYYQMNFQGSSIPVDAFETYAAQASAYVDYLTLNRIGKLKNIPDKVKDAVCAVCEVYYVIDQKEENGGNIKSENTDGYSVSYITEQQDGQLKEALKTKKAYYAAYQYLAFTGLLSRRMQNDYKCRSDNL